MPDCLTLLRNTFQSILKLSGKDAPVIDYVSSVALLARWSVDLEPVWGYVIGPPGSAKTEMLRTLEGWEHAKVIDELTENTLASGYSDENVEDPSLLPQLHEKLLVVKDLASFASGHEHVLMKILSVLRTAYDGGYTKSGGKVGIREYKCKFGMLTATTPTIDYFFAQNQKLGERFIAFRVQRDGPGTLRERQARLKHVRAMMPNKTLWRAQLRETIQGNLTEFLENDPPGPEDVEVPDLIGDRLDLLADLVSRLRTSPYDGQNAPSESGARLVQQLTNLARARAALSGRTSINHYDYSFIVRIGQDSLALLLRKVCQLLYHRRLHEKSSGELGVMSSQELGRWVEVESNSLKNLLQQFMYLGLIEKHQSQYRLCDETMEQMEQAHFFYPPND